MTGKQIQLMAHLMRRAGFGATREELEARVARGYEATVEELLDTDAPDGIREDLLRRYHPDYSGMLGLSGVGSYWLYRMVNSRAPLHEKIALFWHGVFATGYAKLAQGKILMDQIKKFRKHGMGDLRTLLVELSKDPAMIIWLDNQENHNGAINENYGRELLELFSMGVGNYTEQDVKECARAFTGWTVANTEYVEMKARRDSLWPYGRTSFEFEYRPQDHDEGVKHFLGHTGCFNGEDIVDIICDQPATARFISRHLYHFFVADEPPVPQWPYQQPRDLRAINILSKAYFDSKCNVREMLRVLLSSDFFKSESCWYTKVKSPAELLVGTLKLSGDMRKPDPGMQQMTGEMNVMGQTLVNPPSVEGWHQGTEWIDTGTSMERANFAAKAIGDLSKPGVKEMVGRVTADAGGAASPEGLVQLCLNEMGAMSVCESTREALARFAGRSEEMMQGQNGEFAEKRIAGILEMIAASPDFQRG